MVCASGTFLRISCGQHRSTEKRTSFVSQSEHRVDTGGPAGWQQARQQANEKSEKCDADKCGGAVTKTPQTSLAIKRVQEITAEEAKSNASEDQARCFLQN